MLNEQPREPRFTLDAYAARSCPVKVQHTFDPRQQASPVTIDESLAELFAGGIAFEDEILDLVLRRTPEAVDLRPLMEAEPARRQAALAEAVAAGVAVIIKGRLPDDVAGHRRGSPDLLVRGEPTRAGTPGYLPVEIKAHLVTEARSTKRVPSRVAVSALGDPSFGRALTVDDRALRTSREGDLLQVAHYWRVLAAAGWVSDGPRRAGLIGRDDYSAVGGPAPAIVWVDLDAKSLRTFSRSSETGYTARSALERYDHEHRFRVDVAERARRQADPDPPPPLVSPIKIRECDNCQWWSTCRPLLHEDDLSLRIAKAPLDVREIGALRQCGIRTVADLAAADLEELLPRYLPEVRHRPEAEKRLRLTARKALLMGRGVRLERVDRGPIDVPRAQVEIDFDIETSADERIYLWGFLIDQGEGGAETYRPVVEWSDLDDDGELRLARQAIGLLREWAERPGVESLLVYHYSDYELVRLRQVAERTGDPLLHWGLEFAKDHFVDLFRIVRDHWFGVDGLGLKVVASEGAHFAWRDVDPGGLNSQRWFDDAVHAETAAERDDARRRVLEYNEDDVRATWAVRAWLRREHGR